MTADRPIDVNRAHWDDLAQAHAALAADGRSSGYYDLEALVAGATTLLRVEADGVRAAVGDVAGLRVLHAQCHLGLDAVTLARAGARVTGLDFSATALGRAAELAARCGVDVEWVQAEVTSPPDRLLGRFDLVYATMGILCWIEDVDAWMRAMASVLAPGGRLLLVDIHPLYQMVSEREPLRLDFPYTFDGPRRFDDSGSYADAEAVVPAGATVQYGHGLGEIVTAAVGAGLRVVRLAEQTEVEIDPRGSVLERDPDGWFRFRVADELLPVTYSLVVERERVPWDGTVGA